MKISIIPRRLTVAVCVVALTSLVGIIPSQAALRTGKASVKQLKGAAHYSVTKGVWIPLKLNTFLKPGTLLKTAPESTVTLFFKENGTTLTANANTLLRLTKMTSGETGLEFVSEADLALIEGSVTGSQRKTSTLSVFKINGFTVVGDSDYQMNFDGSPIVSKRADSKTGSISQQTSVSSVDVAVALADRPLEKPASGHGNNGVGNGEDPAPPGNPKPNDGPGTGPGNPGNGRPNHP